RQSPSDATSQHKKTSFSFAKCLPSSRSLQSVGCFWTPGKRLPMQSSAANSSRARTSKASTRSTVLTSYWRSTEHLTLS
ncbi:TPA: hypothetical protein N0F65_003952, partial [Lagenidium giganteum]